MSDGVVQLEPSSTDVTRKRSILVIDDDEGQTAALEYRLSRLGFAVRVASRGEIGLRAALTSPPDLLILDLRLPDMEGFEICARLADDPLTSEVPVIIVSALEKPDIVRSARAVGCQYYLRKPYDPNVLLALIERALSDTDW